MQFPPAKWWTATGIRKITKHSKLVDPFKYDIYADNYMEALRELRRLNDGLGMILQYDIYEGVKISGYESNGHRTSG